MYVNQIIMLCTLNLYSAVCQSYLNKTGRKKKGGAFGVVLVILSRILDILFFQYRGNAFASVGTACSQNDRD